MQKQAVILLTCCCWPALSSIAAPVQEPDIAALVAKALSQDEDIDPGILETIGLAQNRMALNGLRDCSERARGDLRPHALKALRHFRGVSELETPAVKFLAEQALSDSNVISQAAARTLALFGDRASRELTRVLDQSEDSRTQQYAVGGLVDVLTSDGSSAALERLLEHYRPWISGSVQLGVDALASFEDPASTKILHKALAKSKTPAGVRMLIARALADRPGAASTAALEKALRDRDAEVVAAAIASLRTRGETGHVRALARLTSHDSAFVRFQAFYALALAQGDAPDFERKLVRALEGNDFAWRMAAAAALGDAKDQKSAERLAQLIDDPHPGVRREAIEQARKRRLRVAIPSLITRMEDDGARLRDTAHSVLVELTALDHGPGPDRWRAWWNGEGSTYQLPTRENASARLRERERRRADSATKAEATFYDLRFSNDRVVFLLDVSGSMELDGRMPRMQREMLASLEQIPDGARFDVILFHTKVIPWGKQLMTMSPRTRQSARNYVNRLRALESTNLHAGLRAAFAHKEVDTIVVLSDGEPTTGVTHSERILADVREWDELRGVAIHCVALGWNGELLQSLADQTQGTFVAAR